MKTTTAPTAPLYNQNGVAAVLTGIAMLMLLSFAALAVDIGYILTTRNELQNIADAAALAAARELGDIYSPPDAATDFDDATHGPLVIDKAIEIGQSNQAGGKVGITINSGDVEIGIWRNNVFRVADSTCPTCPPNATKVTVRRDNSANAPVATFFAKLFHPDPIELTASAVAALSAHSVVVHGQLAADGRGNGAFPWFATRGNIPSLVE